MKVGVVGASGVVGMRVALQLLRQRHRVVGVVFHPSSLEALRRLGVEAVQGDARERGTLFRPLEGCDLVVNATASVAVDPARETFVAQSLAKGPGNVAAVVRSLGVPHLISTSLLRSVRPLDDGPFDEDAVPPPGAAAEAEERARSALVGTRAKHVLLRLADVYSGDSQHCVAMAELLHRQRLPVVGDGAAVQQLLHADDAAAVIAAVCEDLLGSVVAGSSATNFKVYHATDDSGGIAYGTMLHKLAVAIGAPPPRRVPQLLAAMAGVDPAHQERAEASTRASNARLRRHFPHVQLRYPTFDVGVNQMRSFWAQLAQTKQLVVN